MNRIAAFVVGVGAALLAVVAAPPVFAEAGVCEATGTVVDQDGNPIPDVGLRFVPASNPGTSWDGKTNKKGKFYVPGMFNPQGEDWQVTIEAPGWVPTEMTVESRTVNRILIGDVQTKKLSPGAALPTVVIRPLGNAKIDFKMIPEGQAPVAAVAPVPGVAATPEGPKAAPAAKDPWEAALAKVGAGDLAGSIDLFTEAVDAQPEDAERHATLAKVLYQLERYDEAEAPAARAVELAPNDLQARMVQSSIFVAQNELDQARAVLEPARASHPEDAKLARQVAWIASQQGRTEDAIAGWEQVTKLDAKSAEAWLELASLYARAKRSEQSEQAYQKVIELEPNTAHQVFFNLGALLISKQDRSDEDTARAIQSFERAIELKPDYVQAHKQLAYALLGEGDRDGARKQLETCLTLAPNASDAPQIRKLIETLSN